MNMPLNIAQNDVEVPELLKTALSYAARGVPVFPCRPADEMVRGVLKQCKSPYVATGYKAASIEPAQIVKWWTTWSDALIGVPTGERTGFVVLDLDVDPGSEKNGIEVMKSFPDLPDTPMVITPSGGRHYYFKHREGMVTSAGRIGQGVDVRGNGGYVIVPPSRLRDGRQYALVGAQ